MEVSEREPAIPFDVIGVELAITTADAASSPSSISTRSKTGHQASFQDRARRRRKHDLYGEPEAPRPESNRRRALEPRIEDDHEVLEKQFIVYDALYEYCRQSLTSSNKARHLPMELVGCGHSLKGCGRLVTHAIAIGREQT